MGSWSRQVVHHLEWNCLLNSQTQRELYFESEFKESRIKIECDSKKFQSIYS